jgi:hypothetical protein
MLPLVAAQSAPITLVIVVHFPTDLANLQVQFKCCYFFSFFLLENSAGGLFSHHMANIILKFLFPVLTLLGSSSEGEKKQRHPHGFYVMHFLD